MIGTAPRPDLLVNDDGRWWIPCADAPTPAKAKAALYFEVVIYGDWTSLRCQKEWLRWDPDGHDPSDGSPGCWATTTKANPDAVPFYVVYATDSDYGKRRAAALNQEGRPDGE